MKTVCIVQARMGSTRLRGKVLLALNGHTVIGEVLSRCNKIAGVDEVVCAIPDTEENNILENIAGKSVRVVRGPEDDVLLRYRQAAAEADADIIMRITGDCPLLSPKVCAAVLNLLRSEHADYASNVHPRTFPKGMDCEVFTRGTLVRAEEKAYRAEEREHVTTWMTRANIKRANLLNPYPMDGRLVLDTWRDYWNVCASFEDRTDEVVQRLRAA